jgi:hypothetical protein
MSQEENAGTLKGSLELDTSKWMPNAHAVAADAKALSEILDSRLVTSEKKANQATGELAAGLAKGSTAAREAAQASSQSNIVVRLDAAALAPLAQLLTAKQAETHVAKIVRAITDSGVVLQEAQ